MTQNHLVAVDSLIPAVAKDRLLDCLGLDGEVIPSTRLLHQLEEEGLILPDVLYVLECGSISDPAERDVTTGEWEYRIEGCEPDGRRLAVVFSFRAVNRAFLISVISILGR